MACATPAPTSVNVLVEYVRVNAPERPVLCAESMHKQHLKGDDATATLYVFTSDWCAPCERLLRMLEGIQDEIYERGIAIVHVVTGEGDSCFAAARVARRASFPYSAGSRRMEDAWGLRSTPTIWLVDNNSQALLYIEGELSAEEFLGVLGQ